MLGTIQGSGADTHDRSEEMMCWRPRGGGGKGGGACLGLPSEPGSGPEHSPLNPSFAGAQFENHREPPLSF